ncbi:hypothetical protein HYW75_04845 [Candidatus Pacearchaeota archaeon]|nr:hypothetical protein [Candidatus Pacearchaeota archaeon]
MGEKKSIFRSIIDSIRRGNDNRKLKKSPIYQAIPKIEPFKVIKITQGDFTQFNNRIDNDSLIMLVFGKRGSGKSSLGFRLLENIHSKTKRSCFVLGIEKRLLPKWIYTIENVDEAPNNSIILVDEGAISFNSRNSMKIRNKELTNLLAIARHKSLTLIFITQNTGLIDKNVLKLADTLFIKEGSLLQLEMERPEIKKFYEKAKNYFNKLEKKEKVSYVLDSDFEGVIEHELPSFWSEQLSRNRVG